MQIALESPVFWLFAIVSAVIAAYIGVSEARRVPPALRFLMVPPYAAAGFACGVAAYFHRGAAALNAGIVAFVLVGLVGVLQFVVKAFYGEGDREGSNR